MQQGGGWFDFYGGFGAVVGTPGDEGLSRWSLFDEAGWAAFDVPGWSGFTE